MQPSIAAASCGETARKAAAKAVFERILERWPQDVLAINSLAYDALLSDHKTQALQYYAQALTLQPQVCNAHFNHAYVAEQLDLLALAEEGFRAALQIDEKMDRAWCGRGGFRRPCRPWIATPACSP